MRINEEIKLKYLNYNRFVHSLYDFYNRLRNFFYIKTIKLHSQVTKNCTPFFIVGSGRSGNTILRRVLSSQYGIVIPPETYVLGKIFRLHHVHKNLRWEDYVNLILSTFEYHSQFYTFELGSLSELAKELKKCKSDQQNLAHVIDQFYRFYGLKKRGKVIKWGDKTPINSIYVYKLKRLFPKAKFIHMIRDGLDVTHSYVKAGIYDDYSLAALRWKKSVNFLQSFGEKFPKHYLEVKYENLVKNPEKYVKDVCRFIGIEYEKSMITDSHKASDMGDVSYLDHHKNVSKKINDSSVGKGRRKLSNDDLKVIVPILEETLITNGYSIPSVRSI